MPLESASYIHQLEPANPAGTDQMKQADDHLRLIKQTLRNTFPNLSGPVTLDQDALNNPTVIPVGATIVWYGSAGTVPAGWAICDGSEVPLSAGGGTIVTPNLVDRTVIGAGTIAPQGTSVGAATSTVNTTTAGAHQHTISGGAHTHEGTALGHVLTEAELPAHHHLIAKNGVSSNILSNGNYLSQETTAGGDTEYRLKGVSGTPDVGRSGSTGSGNAHSHDVQIESATHSHSVSSAGDHAHSVSVSTIQPSMGLHWIMKV